MKPEILHNDHMMFLDRALETQRTALLTAMADAVAECRTAADQAAELTETGETGLLRLVEILCAAKVQRGQAGGDRAGGHRGPDFGRRSGPALRGVKNYCDNLFQGLIDNARNDVVRDMFSGIKEKVDNNIPDINAPDAKTLRYKPEYSLNYEIGTHLNLLERCFSYSHVIKLLLAQRYYIYDVCKIYLV